jgi:undecaprenyl pyrophosphate phosphatase UppP
MLGAVLTIILYCRTDLIPPTNAKKRAGRRSTDDIPFTVVKYVLITTGIVMLVGLAWRKLLTTYYGRPR